MTKIVIYGSACNPPHLVHHAILKDLKSLDFDDVWYIPCYEHMFGKEMVSSEDRLAMANIVASIEDVTVCDIEITNQRRMGTYETLTDLLLLYPNVEFSFTIGGDNIIDFQKWKNWQTLAENYQIICYQRHGCKIQDNPYVKPVLDRMQKLVIREIEHNNLHSILLSSTAVRGWLKDGDTLVEQYVHPKVLQYIRINKLYGAL